MSQSRHDRLQDLFLRARRLAEPDRGKFLKRECGAASDLHAEVDSLLEADQQRDLLDGTASEAWRQAAGSTLSNEALDLPDVRGGSADDPLDTQALIERLSGRGHARARYAGEGELARGGMGAILKVWDRDLRRHLAMKVMLDREGDSESPELHGNQEQLSRFLEEAQVTGQLDHPGVVPVHEVGVDDHGRLFFTMQLVRGRDLRDVFELVKEGKEGWNVTRALHVLLRACEAIAYAHAKGVIHRDLKPSNVMVGRFGEVYVMDWGLARVLGSSDRHDLRLKPADTQPIRTERQEHRSPHSPLVTMEGRVVGTPSYMSPEQGEGRVQGLGPHSDVYSMGAMLYELLTGQVPYVRSGTSPSPHTILAALLDRPPRPIQVIRPQVPAELVAICEKAMARRATHRYSDTQELADDLRAYLEHRVVKAYRTGALVELHKWMGRNRGFAFAAAVAILALVAGVLVAQDGWRTARAEEASARREATRAARLNEFLVGMFESVRPEEQRGHDVRVSEVLAVASRRLEDEFQQYPELELPLRETLAQTYLQIAEPAAAEQHARILVAMFRGDPGPSWKLAKALMLLANCLLNQRDLDSCEQALQEGMLLAERADQPILLGLGCRLLGRLFLERGEFAVALEQYEKAKALLEPLGPLGAKYLASTFFSEGIAQMSLGDLDAAERAFERQLQLLLSLELGSPASSSSTLMQLARIARERGDYEREQGLAEEAHAIRSHMLGPDHPQTLWCATAVAVAVQRQGRPVSEELNKQLQRAETLLAADMSVVAGLAWSNLGLFTERQGQLERAQRCHEKALLAFEASGEANSMRAAIALHNLGAIQLDRGLMSAAVVSLERSLAIKREIWGDRNPRQLVATLRSLSFSLSHVGNPRRALPLAEEAMDLCQANWPEDSAETGMCGSYLGAALLANGRSGEAEPALRRALQLLAQELGETHLQTLYCLDHLADCLVSLGAYEEARDVRARAVDGYLMQPRAGPILAARLCNRLGIRLYHLEEHSLALDEFLEGYSVLESEGGEDVLLSVDLLNNAGATHLKTGNWAEAEPLFRDATTQARARLPAEHTSLLKALQNLADACENLEKTEESLKLWREIRGVVPAESVAGQKALRKIRELSRELDGN